MLFEVLRQILEEIAENVERRGSLESRIWVGLGQGTADFIINLEYY